MVFQASLHFSYLTPCTLIPAALPQHRTPQCPSPSATRNRKASASMTLSRPSSIKADNRSRLSVLPALQPQCSDDPIHSARTSSPLSSTMSIPSLKPQDQSERVNRPSRACSRTAAPKPSTVFFQKRTRHLVYIALSLPPAHCRYKMPNSCGEIQHQ